MATTITTSRQNRELSFDGELIARADSAMHVADRGEISLAVQLFAIHGGGFVGSVEVRYGISEPVEVVEAELVDTMTDVEHIFYLVDPNDIVDPKIQLAPKVRRELQTAYDTLVYSVLDAMKEYHASHPDCETALSDAPAQVSGFWKLMGMG